jgi:hypothetical protein
VIKPKPLSALNHLTVPAVITANSLMRLLVHGRKPSSRDEPSG